MEFASRHQDFKQWWRQGRPDRGVSLNILHFSVMARELCIEATERDRQAELTLLQALWDEDEAMAAASPALATCGCSIRVGISARIVSTCDQRRRTQVSHHKHKLGISEVGGGPAGWMGDAATVGAMSS